MNQNVLFIIFLPSLSAGLIYFKTTTVHYMQNRHQILWKCFKKGFRFVTISLKKDFTAETYCCYFQLAQHSEVPQNSTHLSMGKEIISFLEKNNISEIISFETWIYSEVPQNSPRSSWTAAMGALNCLLCGGTNSQSKIIFDLGTGWESSKITT